MGSDATQELALGGGFANERDIAMGEIANTAVDHLGASTAGARSEVPGFQQDHPHAAGSRRSRDARAGDPATDYDHAEGLLLGESEEAPAVPKVEVRRADCGNPISARAIRSSCS